MAKLTRYLIPIVIILVGLVIGIWIIYPSLTKKSSFRILSSQEVGEKVLKYINENIPDGEIRATIVESGEESGVYKFKLKVEEQEFEAFTTKDGKFLFIAYIDLTQVLKEQVQEEEFGEKDGAFPISLEQEPTLGSSAASLTIIEFTDFECPFCAKFHQETFPQIKKEYIDTGKVKIVVKNFPLSIHKNAQIAAEAGECAFEQEKFWEYKDTLFKNQEALEVDDLKKYARDLGLDSQKFDNCLDSGKYKDEVQADLKEGEEAGVTGTPTFLIEEKEIVGAQPFSEFQKIVEEKLK